MDLNNFLQLTKDLSKTFSEHEKPEEVKIQSFREKLEELLAKKEINEFKEEIMSTMRSELTLLKWNMIMCNSCSWSNLPIELQRIQEAIDTIINFFKEKRSGISCTLEVPKAREMTI